MEISRKKILTKLQKKNRGNVPLCDAIDQLIEDLESNDFASFEELKAVRKDADRVHTEGFCFFDIHVHRTMILLQFDDLGIARIVWAGSHDEYESTFKNNKDSIAKWLKSNGWI